jgi:hydrogenase maturation protease
MRRLAVIGCGNATRCDDGVGPAVVRLLIGRGFGGDEHVRLLDAGTDGMAVMFAARGCEELLIVDACRSGASPGAIFEVPGAELEQRTEAALTLHDFRWNHALHVGRQIFGAAFPRAVTVFLIEAASIDFGCALSAPVQQAAEVVADRIARTFQLGSDATETAS